MASHYIAQTDIRVAKGIWRSMQSKYNKAHVIYGERAVQVVKCALPILEKQLDLPPDLNIRIASVKGRVRGWYVSKQELAIVDYMLRGRQVLETLCHELVHAEQYHQGRLKTEWIDRDFQDVWMGSAVKASYTQRPWEIEAWARQVELADLVVDQLGTDFLALKKD